uniref:Uncharacterized protein n=1 Tax=Latimeria chalumnae TaxID=7897 RepID=H2ZZI3_LATCH
ATTPSANTTTPHPISNAAMPSANTTTPHPISNAATTPHPISNAAMPSANTTTPHPISNAAMPSAKTTTLHPTSNTTAPTNHTTPAVHPTTTVGPTLSPKPSPPEIGNYTIMEKEKICIMALLGTKLIVKSKEKKESYFNIVPNVPKPTGLCNEHTSFLHLGFSGGYANFTFTKDKSQYYVSATEAELDPVRLEIKSLNEKHHGKIEKQKLFSAKQGNSYKCKSKETVHLGEPLDLVTIGAQLQAFDFNNGHFGKEDECSTDRNRRIIVPIAVVACIVGLLIIAFLAYLIGRKRSTGGYQCI